MFALLFVDSGFGCVLDVFVDPSISFANVIFFDKHHAWRNGCSRCYVPLASVTTRIRICGSSRYGETSQATIPHIAILQRPTRQNGMNDDQCIKIIKMSIVFARIVFCTLL